MSGGALCMLGQMRRLALFPLFNLAYIFFFEKASLCIIVRPTMTDVTDCSSCYVVSCVMGNRNTRRVEIS